MDCVSCHLEKRLKIAEQDILELQRTNGNQGIVLAELRIEVKGLVASVGTLLEKVEVLASISSKRYENIVFVVTALVLGAIAGRWL